MMLPPLPCSSAIRSMAILREYVNNGHEVGRRVSHQKTHNFTLPLVQGSLDQLRVLSMPSSNVGLTSSSQTFSSLVCEFLLSNPLL
jgi:hypothetical protein